MSQQQMNFDEINRNEPTSYAAGYEETPHYNTYSSASFGQKLSGHESSGTPTAGQRLALAIVSLVLWMLVFLIVAITISTISPDNPVSRVAFPFLISALLIFSAIVFFINFLFNRRR